MTKRSLRYFILAAFLFSTTIICQAQVGAFQKFRLLPLPKKIETSPGQPTAPASLKSIFISGMEKKPILPASLEILSDASASGKGVVTLIITESGVPESKEGYVLDISNGQVKISSRDKAGIFYGCRTLAQMVEDATDQKINIPSGIISDMPDIDYRSIHLDLKHHLDSTSYYYHLMDRLADVKVNAVIIEFEDKLKYKGAPSIGSSNAISIEEFAKLSEYAKERNIEISPLIQGLGHASFILKHPEYKELRDDSTSDWSFDPLNPETYALQFALYKDAIAATPHGRYLHVGGDEVGKLGSSELAKKSGMKPFELQMNWLTKVCAFAEQNNRIPVFWDDMVFKLSGLYETTYDPSIPEAEVEKRWKENEKILNENIHLFPKNCVFMRWNYDYPGLLGNRKAIEWYKAHDLKVMAATAGQQIWAMMPRANSNFEAVRDFSRITAEEKLTGIFLTLWDDASPHFETYWRGIYDYAFFTWNYRDIKQDDLHAIFRHRFYGPALAASTFEFQDLLEKAMPFWETALINKGNRETYPEKIDTLSLPDPASSGSWSVSNAKKLSDAKKQIVQYEIIKQKIKASVVAAKRNKYALSVFDGINELQVYSAKLLLSLEQYDKTTGTSKDRAADAVRNQVSEFAALRKKYEQVFSGTRILHNPQNYLLDQNHHHHLANGTLTNDWMFVYELALNERINNFFSR